jgi:hypothetical protein
MTPPPGTVNLQYYTERLADPGLLDSALITECGDLAVPAGGIRRGGWTSIVSVAEGGRLIERMRESPSLFPDPRFAYHNQVIMFGPDAPDDDAAAGRHYGYSDAAIAKFLRRVADMEERS